MDVKTAWLLTDQLLQQLKDFSSQDGEPSTSYGVHIYHHKQSFIYY